MYMSTVKVSELSEYVREMRARENSYHVTQVIFAHLFPRPLHFGSIYRWRHIYISRRHILAPTTLVQLVRQIVLFT